jgi:ribosomal protein S12 methylthiotransferase accessory factor
MAAGNTASEAKVQALSEIFERYVKNKIIAEGICLPRIPKEVLQRFPESLAVIEQLEGHGFHLRVCDASLGDEYPVISVTLINPKDGAVFASFGAHPCFEVALERTVTELLQGRDLNNLEDFQAPTFNLDEVSDSGNLETHFVNATGLLSYEFFKEEADYDFVDWNHDSDTSSEEEYLSQIIHANGFEIYVAEYDFLGVYACRILVPGMSEIYPVEDLVWSNNNEGASFGETILNLKHLEEEVWQELFDALEEGGFNDLHKVAEFIGVIPDEDTKWSSLTIAELKAMLALALGDTESALEWNRWSLHSLDLDDEAKRFHRCLDALLEIQEDALKDYEEYAPSLGLMYTQEVLDLCVSVINGHENFYGLHSPGLTLDGFNKHQKLLEAYAKVHKAKTNNSGFTE